MANMLRGMKRNKVKQGPKELPKGQNVPEASPQQVEQIKTVGGALIGLAHDPKGSQQVHKVLQSGKPEISVAQAAMMVYQQFKAGSGNRPIGLEVAMPGYMMLVDDLLDFGNQAGFFNVTDEQGAGMILQNSFQLFIETGLKDKSIDPLELQEAVEPMMTDEQRGVGQQIGQEAGVPGEMSPQMATEQQITQGVAKAQPQGMLQGGQRNG